MPSRSGCQKYGPLSGYSERKVGFQLPIKAFQVQLLIVKCVVYSFQDQHLLVLRQLLEHPLQRCGNFILDVSHPILKSCESVQTHLKAALSFVMRLIQVTFFSSQFITSFSKEEELLVVVLGYIELQAQVQKLMDNTVLKW